MKTAFEQAIDYTFGNEGGFGDDPNDSGGPTNFGITQGDLARWRNRPVSAQEVKEMGADEAKGIYSAWYWRPLGCDKITSQAVAICMFDIGIVRGVSIPPQYAQEICNAHGAGLVLDGHLGPLSLTAINAIDPKAFVTEFAARTKSGFLGIIVRHPTQTVFIKGWLNRAARLLTLVEK
jgi:lysozyme family protein